MSWLKKLIIPGSCIGGGIGLLVLWKDRLGGGRFQGNETLYGRTVIVTGANSGIGKCTAQELAKRGARVILACRDIEKCEKTREAIESVTFNRNLECKKLNLTSFQSVREFAEDINKNEQRLDRLINNAGVMGLKERTLTKDKIEEQLQVNYLGHFLLTELLLDKLRTCAPSRVVNNISADYRKGKIDFTDLNSLQSYKHRDAYAQSKLATMIWSEELDKRLKGTGVSCYCSLTGLSFTKIHRHLGWYKNYFSGVVLAPIYWLIMNSPSVGAQNTIHCVLSSELGEREIVQHTVFFKGCKPLTYTSPYKYDPEIATRLWLTSEYWTGLKEFQEKPKS